MRPLPFVWPWALLFWSVFVWAFAPESGIVWRAAKSSGAKDAKSVQVIILGLNGAFFAAFPLSWVPALQFTANRVALFWVGTAAIVAGSLLRRHCWRMLGASFTGDVRASADQQIVTRGAYSVLRHPSYTAAFMMNVGIGLALGGWASTLVVLVASLVVYSYRIMVEERALLAAIGEPYRFFMSTRKRLIPFVY